MKVLNTISGSLGLIILAVSAAYSQQQFTHTVTAQNKYCNSTCSLMDMPALNNNPSAIIIITPLNAASNPHPVGVFYVTEKKQWSAINVDYVGIVDGAKFSVQYYTSPDASRFVYVIPQQGFSCIDRSGLNGNPGAQVRITPTTAPNGAYFNLHETKVEYDAPKTKWCISNINFQTMRPGSAFNVVFIERSNTDLTPLGSDGTAPGKTPVVTGPAPATGKAGGDLSGSYPDPTVQRINGNPVSGAKPAFGQILKWNGNAWEPADIVTPTNPTSPATVNKPSALYYNQSDMVNMYNANMPAKPIPGLDNQTFTLSQSSRVVFHTTIEAKTFADSQNALDTYGISQARATGVWLTVEILNASNAAIARSVSAAWLTRDTPQTILSTGIGILPAGTYHTKVTVKKQEGGARLDIKMFFPSSGNQGGQMILEIFPD